jgi:hypothetical protein
MKCHIPIKKSMSRCVPVTTSVGMVTHWCSLDCKWYSVGFSFLEGQRVFLSYWRMGAVLWEVVQLLTDV